MPENGASSPNSRIVTHSAEAAAPVRDSTADRLTPPIRRGRFGGAPGAGAPGRARGAGLPPPRGRGCWGAARGSGRAEATCAAGVGDAGGDASGPCPPGVFVTSTTVISGLALCAGAGAGRDGGGGEVDRQGEQEQRQ